MKILRPRFSTFCSAGIAAALVITALTFSPPDLSKAATPRNTDLYKAKVPDVNVNLTAQVTRQADALQQEAIQHFKSGNGRSMVRWNDFAGSPDVLMGFSTSPSGDTPENVARDFVAQNSALFGVEPAALVLADHKEALGGHILRFQQKAGDLNVATGGLGFVMDGQKQIRMVIGSTFRGVSVSDGPTLNAAGASARAVTDIGQYAAQLSAAHQHLFAPALDTLAAELAPVLRDPRLNVFPTADGYRLSWDVVTFSRNPFGLFRSQVDAGTGEILYRENLVRAQLPNTADIFPSTPVLDDPDQSTLKMVDGVPEGLTRVTLRNVNPGANAMGVDGTISGKHALVRNILATKQPFLQAAGGTFHFRENNAPIEAQPNEADDLAEPAEHFDTSNMYFFINYLLEYVDHIHVAGDNNTFGGGAFPDDYVNHDRPLVGLVHMPNVPGVLGVEPDTTNETTLLRSLLGLDNAFSVPVSETIDTPAGPQKVVVNPTLYGHGYLLNDLGKDGPVAYHEGMHSISTPIAGLEGAPEGGALNEGQADLWAYAITGGDTIGEYSIKGKLYRQLYRDNGLDPDRLAYIRSARSSLKYSQLGTKGNPGAFAVHNDGEIYASTMFDLLALLKASEPQEQFTRPAFDNGQPTRKITRGQNTWERLFLGSLYILGGSPVDTFTKARDAMLVADQLLYPTDSSDPDSAGRHEALIWQVFASHEIGINAMAPRGGAVTISTAVPEFAVQQPGPSAPQGVMLSPTSTRAVNVSWQPVAGAYGYEIFKRKAGTHGKRQKFGNLYDRPYFDGDNSTTGWSHVAYVNGGSNSYEDRGFAYQFFAPAGIRSFEDSNGFNEMFGMEYAVRAISLNPSGQSGFGDLSAGASLSSSIQDVTDAIKASMSNVSFANGIFEFDQTLKNNGVSGPDPTAYGSIDFKVLRISDPTITVANADNGGNGKDVPAVFTYNQTLAVGETSSSKRLKFNDPGAKLFTFDAMVSARVRGTSQPANGSQPADGDGGGRFDHVITSSTDTYDGVILLGTAGLNLSNGVDYVDVPFVGKPGAFGVNAKLSTTIFADVDFELRDSNGRVLASSGNLGPDEELSGLITPGQNYVYRVVGYGNGPTPFNIISEQYLSDTIGGNSGSQFTGTQTQGLALIRIVRFTVNPLTKTVTAKLL